jgi:hypothetical protein
MRSNLLFRSTLTRLPTSKCTGIKRPPFHLSDFGIFVSQDEVNTMSFSFAYYKSRLGIDKEDSLGVLLSKPFRPN